MTTLDYVLLGLILVSVVISIWRGLVREVVSLLAWLVALWVAARFSVVLADWLATAIAAPAARYITAFVALFLCTIIVLELLGMLVAKLLHTVGLGFVDRTLGAIFGFARGVLLAWILVLLGGLTSLPQQAWWQESLLAPPLQAAVLAARPLLPLEIAKRLSYA